jgi:hypothetical protein
MVWQNIELKSCIFEPKSNIFVNHFFLTITFFQWTLYNVMTLNDIDKFLIVIV